MDEDVLASGGYLEMVNAEDPFQEAIVKSLEIGSVMPLVKEELKLKIQSRRLSEGRGELKVEFTSPPKYEVKQERSETDNKIETRKKRNRQSASKSRQKRKGHEESILKEVEKQQAIHANLQIEVNSLRNIKKLLQVRISKHLAKCPKYGKVMSQQTNMNPLDKEAWERLREVRKFGALSTSILNSAFPNTPVQWKIAIPTAT
ncbi:hypothetical protein ACJMK2_035394 [Sinanodonta woodiana]|uniref:BZIP domain-containing protein n=1 Tax=Sinanodonta woodiana TaxID=1069815 RepID=A0ABD3WUT1_SINWO